MHNPPPELWCHNPYPRHSHICLCYLQSLTTSSFKAQMTPNWISKLKRFQFHFDSTFSQIPRHRRPCSPCLSERRRRHTYNSVEPLNLFVHNFLTAGIRHTRKSWAPKIFERIYSRLGTNWQMQRHGPPRDPESARNTDRPLQVELPFNPGRDSTTRGS